ncbi:MAG: HIT domain-containing protein [Candidatus Aminicenantes bacterium]|nr:HIT domain-containing protein [Candidatus Aminicenantes bacterium]
MEDCLFCKIAKKEIPSETVYENDSLIAFRDIDPQAPTHILIIPKEHFASLEEIPEEKKGILADLLLAARQIAKDKELSRGYRIVLNTGKDSGQAVFHIHFHLLGGRQMTWPPG